jgi:hypothetical protein
MNRRKFIGASTAVFGLWNLPSWITSANEGSGGVTPLRGGTAQTAARAFGYKGEHFLLDGEPFLLGWGKGYVWLNGYNLGRYCKIGPQQRLFVPSLWLRKGINQVIVLDLELTDHRTLQGIRDPTRSEGMS